MDREDPDGTGSPTFYFLYNSKHDLIEYGGGNRHILTLNAARQAIKDTLNGVFNRRIKEVARLAEIVQSIKFSHKKGNKDIVIVKPKYGWVTSHTCRRSFCTNEFLAGTPVDFIIKISGHKSLRDFYKYISITPEGAGQKIKDIWQTRGDMNLVKEGNVLGR